MMQSDHEYLRAALASGANHSDLIAMMQSRGLSILDAIKASRELLNINLGAAKQLVTSHPSYASEAEKHTQFHDELIRILEDDADLGR